MLLVEVNNQKNTEQDFANLQAALSKAMLEKSARDIVIRKLKTACEKALHLRGLVSAINDPLSFAEERKLCRQRFINTEREIRQALEEADKLR